MDLIDIGFAAFAATGLVALFVVIVWPLKPRDDVMSQVHGDQPELPQ